MMRILSVIYVIVIGVLTSVAQDKSSLLQRINEIKSQSDVYYWDQYTHPDVDTSKVNSTKRLLLHINVNRGDNGLSAEDVKPYARYILIDRGNLKQYFAYIKKDEADAINRSSTSAHTSGTPVVGVPVNGTVSKAVQPTSTPKPFVPDAFVQRIMEPKTFMNVHKLLKSMQSLGQVLQFGKLKDVEDYSSLDLILFDMQTQEIVTMLSPVTTSGNRINLVNGMEDSLDNYPRNMTAVIWYIKK